ncbi:MAG: Hsp20 family protein [Alphaproteobacteria bacterium]|nr:Hsp20 family protein [Alphaproteobacteria bacterium]
MTSFDLSPLFRSAIGFDRLNQLVDSAMRSAEANDSFPPYNIEKTGETDYRITMAVAGFGEDDLNVEVREGVLVVAGKAKPETEGARFLHRGIARRAFERRFQLADHVVVRTAALENGLLRIELARELPEAMKPRRIAIAARGAKPPVIDAAAA